MGGSGVPHVAELINGVWYCDCCDGPMEETLGVKVVAWFDMQTIKERSRLNSILGVAYFWHAGRETWRELGQRFEGTVWRGVEPE